MADHIQIGDIAPRIQYVANGTQVQFTYPFPIFIAADLEVYLGETKQSSGYTVNGAGQSAGGTVTFAAAPANATIVTLRRRIAIQRTSDFQESGEFRAKVINDELDYQTAALQQVADDMGRTIRLSAIDTAADLTLPVKAIRASKVLGFDADGDPAVSTKTLAQLETEASAAAASATAAAAFAASGLYATTVDKSANYTVVEADEGNLIRVDSSGAERTITLPDVTAFTTDFRVAITKWDNGANTVTIQRSGTNTINGATNFMISSQYQVVNFIGDKETGTWLASDASVGSIQTFKTVAVAGQSSVVADAAGDTLTLIAGSGVAITTNAGTDEITIAASGGGSPGWTKKASGSFSGISTLDFTGITKTTRITLVITGNSATDGVYMRCSTNNGSSFDTNTLYDYAAMYERIENSVSSGYNVTQDKIYLARSAQFGTVANKHSGLFATTLVSPESDQHKIIHCESVINDANGGQPRVDESIAQYRSTSAVNAVRFFTYDGPGTFTGFYLVEEINAP